MRNVVTRFGAIVIMGIASCVAQVGLNNGNERKATYYRP